MERREGEDESELSRRVQSALAEELEVMGSEVTIEDVNKWMTGMCELSRKGEYVGLLVLSPLRNSRDVLTLSSTASCP